MLGLSSSLQQKNAKGEETLEGAEELETVSQQFNSAAVMYG